MPVVRRPISANLGLNLNPDFIIPFVQKPPPFLFKAYNHQIVYRKNYTGFLNGKTFKFVIRSHTNPGLP